jgi:hypothetical protein
MQQHLGYAVLDIDELEPYDGNARRHDDKVLANSVKVHGQYRTLVVRVIGEDPEHPEKYVLLAGHGTAAAMRANRHTKARAELVVCDDEEALQINLIDNRAGDVAWYDEDALAAQLEQAAGFDFAGTGWDAKSAAKYLDPGGGKPPAGDGEPSQTWAIVVECRDEEQQADLLAKFDAEGLNCRPLIA